MIVPKDKRTNEKRAADAQKASQAQRDDRKAVVEGTREESKMRLANLQAGYPVRTMRLKYDRTVDGVKAEEEIVDIIVEDEEGLPGKKKIMGIRHRENTPTKPKSKRKRIPTSRDRNARRSTEA